MMDILELLLETKNNGIPNEKEKRVELLKQLYETKFFYIYYEGVCEYCSKFKDMYGLPEIKRLLRKNHIFGSDLKKELEYVKDEEEKYLLMLFFKGKIEGDMR